MRIEAIENSTMLEISKTSLDDLLASSQSFASYFRTLSENASIAANERIIDQLSQTAEQRYEVFYRKYAALRDRLSQKRIASFLGISAEYFNQIEKRRK
jgi:CRP-like cAMP-binding protein